MSFDLDPLYAFYVFAALAAILVAEALYLLFHNRSDYRSRVNRRLEISAKDGDREKVLVQLRRERGLSADGEALMAVAWFNRLVTQSGMKVGLWRAVTYIAAIGLAIFTGVLVWRRDPVLGGIAAIAGMALLAAPGAEVHAQAPSCGLRGAAPGRDGHHRALAARRASGPGRDRHGRP